MTSTTFPLSGRGLAGALMLGALTLGVQPAFATFKSALDRDNFNPDIQVSGLDVSYIANTGVFNLTANDGGGFFTNAAGDFAGSGNADYNLSAVFGSQGSVLNSGSLTITAGTDGFNTPAGSISDGTVMLSGQIFDFGFSGSGDGNGTFEFLLTDLASAAPELDLYLDDFALSIASTTSPLTGSGSTFSDNSWLAGNVDFSGSDLTSDTSVPVPATVLLLGFGLLGLGAVRRHRLRAAA